MSSRVAFLLPLCGAGVAAAALSACTVTPRYPIEEGQGVGGGVAQVRPRYSIDGEPLPPPARASRGASSSPAASFPRDADAPRVAPSGSVESRALPSASADRPSRRPPVMSAGRATPAVLSPSPYAQGAPRPPVLASSSRVTVGEGESVFDIAERYRIPVRALIEANGLQPPYALTPGAVLTIPPPLVYTVQDGDTLIGVARRFNIDPRSLASLNDTTLEASLTRGQAIALPSLARDQGANPQAAGPSPPGSTLGRSDSEAGLRGESYPKPAAFPPPPASSPSRSRAARLPAKTAEDARQAVADAADRERADAAAASGPVTDAQVGAAGRGRFVLPLKGELIATYGAKGLGQRNDGVNIAAPKGSTVKAAAAGEVVYSGDAIPGFGNLVLIKHAGGWVTAYAHLDTITVKMRATVAQGERIGTVGQSGGVDQPQLHFEIRYPPGPDASAKPVDPALLLPGLR